MPRAMHCVEAGLSVSATAAEVGYSAPHYFSRMFTQVLGLALRDHLQRVEKSRHGKLMRFDEREQATLLAPG